MQNESALSAAVVVPASTSQTGTLSFPRRAFEHWKRAAHSIGVVQTRFLMLVIYAIVVVPTGLLMRLSRDPLHLRRPEHSNWSPTHERERSVDAARQQF